MRPSRNQKLEHILVPRAVFASVDYEWLSWAGHTAALAPVAETS